MSEKMKTTCITMTSEQMAQMQALQATYRLSRSALLRQLVADAALVNGIDVGFEVTGETELADE